MTTVAGLLWARGSSSSRHLGQPWHPHTRTGPNFHPNLPPHPDACPQSSEPLPGGTSWREPLSTAPLAAHPRIKAVNSLPSRFSPRSGEARGVHGPGHTLPSRQVPQHSLLPIQGSRPAETWGGGSMASRMEESLSHRGQHRNPHQEPCTVPGTLDKFSQSERGHESLRLHQPRPVVARGPR